METADLEALGNRIRERRKTLCLTQEELAAKANIDRSYIGGVERGERKCNTHHAFLHNLCSFKVWCATLTQGLPELSR
jgi:transcriptional regulator with XRE-family HTH domain